MYIYTHVSSKVIPDKNSPKEVYSGKKERRPSGAGPVEKLRPISPLVNYNKFDTHLVSFCDDIVVFRSPMYVPQLSCTVD